MFDITKKRASDTANIELKNGDGSPMVDEKGAVLSVTVCGPGSKTWQQANAERNRKRAKRLRETGGRIEEAVNGEAANEETVAFLVAITVSFNGFGAGAKAEGETMQDVFRKVYSDEALGFIRDQVHEKANDWAPFTKGSANG